MVDVHANPDKLERYARDVRRAAQQLEQLSRELRRGMEQAEWKDSEGTRFGGEITTLCKSLSQAATTLEGTHARTLERKAAALRSFLRR